MKHVNWQYCKDLNDINEAIKNRDEDWEGLTSADYIISITYNPSHGCYVVFWKMEIVETTLIVVRKERSE